MFRRRNIFAVFILVILVVAFWSEIVEGFSRAKETFFPCQKPIEYSIDVYDTRFNLPIDEFIQALLEAEAMWEGASGEDLFEFVEEGDLKVNLVFDSRQEATQKLQSLNQGINSSKDQYQALKDEYDSLKAQYSELYIYLEQEIAEFEADRAEFEKNANYWNTRGGAPAEEYQKLEKERVALNEKARSLNISQNQLNQTIDDINAVAIALNKLAHSVNKGVAIFNNVAESQGEEFEEGNYELDSLGERINVYQFENRQKLVRLLAHEMGHALGVGHVEDPDAIMHRLNASPNMDLTDSDISALKVVCRLE